MIRQMVPKYGFQNFHQDARLRLHVPCCNERNVGVETPNYDAFK